MIMKIDVFWRTAPYIPVYVQRNVGGWQHYTLTWQKTVIFKCNFCPIVEQISLKFYILNLTAKNSCIHELHMFLCYRFFFRVIQN
jgi:hypothetical protein